MRLGWRKEDQSKYVGGYGKVAGLIGACRAADLISEEDHAELLRHLDSAGRSNDGQMKISYQELVGAHSDAESHPSNEAGRLLLQGIGYSFSPHGLAKEPKENIFSVDLELLPVFPSMSEPPMPSWLSGSCETIPESPEFNCRTRGNVQADAPMLVRAMQSPHDLIKRYKIDPDVFGAWVIALAAVYQPNPYHNYLHALDVFQYSHMCLARGGHEFLTYQDILVILVASYGHDAGHPGYTNPFLVNSSSELALTYNDRSPLENMHASMVFQVMKRPGKEFLGQLATHDFNKIRTKIVDVILATDMVHHFSLVDKFSTRFRKREDSPLTQDTKEDKEKMKGSQEDRRMLIQVFVHMADIGSGCRPWDVHKVLAAALEEEFFAQGDREKQLGLPIMPMNDRTKDSVAASQAFFLGKLVFPLLDPFCHFVSPELRDTFIDTQESNKNRWAMLVERHGKKSAKEVLSLEASRKPLERLTDESSAEHLPCTTMRTSHLE